ncbi:methyltransferase domain-containing protein [Amycolatopsis sp. cg13]|uniref:methyltransferase domain-containing protein n=1 Tax=Amycolatopsis sp. cg13 TaxID=3238807 RepID=UPI0035241ED3
MSGHTHDHIDWADRLVLLRAADTLDAPAQAAIAARLVAKLPANPTVIDLGCGAGGMSTHFAQALATQQGGTIILVDATPELLHEAERAVRAAADAAQSNRHAAAAGGSGSRSTASEGSNDRTTTDGDAEGRAPEGGTASAVEVRAGAADMAAADLAVAGGVAPTAEVRAVAADVAAADLAEAGGVASAVEVRAVAADMAAADLAEAGGVASAVEVRAVAADMAAADIAEAGVTAPTVEVRAIVADLADSALPDLLPAADLVWASRVVHHLPDQQAAMGTLAAVARAGGVVALAEGGLSFSCLPWDLGVGRPGLEDRLQAAQAEWFVGMREGIDGAVPMPYGWTVALERAGLADVSSFSALVDHPAPGPDGLADYVHHHLSRLATHGADHLAEEDRATLASLLDPDSSHYLGKRRDLFLLGARTVHHGRRP